MRLSVIIPVYNERDNIKSIIEEILSVVKSITVIDKLQIIVVDDHSSDDSFEIIKNMNNPIISCLRLSRRCGSHTSIRAGLREATGDTVLCISGDGQEDPACLEGMLKKWRAGADIVWALRKNRNNESWFIRNTAHLFYKMLIRLNREEIYNFDLNRADFYLLDRKVVNAVNSCPERNTSIFGLIIWLGFNQNFVEYERRKRQHGKSKWNFRARLKLALDWIIAFSGLPLRLISLVGILVACFGFIFTIYLIVNAIRGKPMAGWSSIMVAILVLGGFQMTMLGIIGEYLWRNIEDSRGRPLYFIEKDTSESKKGA